MWWLVGVIAYLLLVAALLRLAHWLLHRDRYGSPHPTVRHRDRPRNM